MAPLPQLILEAGATVTFEALDPATFAAVAGVRIVDACIYGDDLRASQAGEPDPTALPVGLIGYLPVSGATDVPVTGEGA